jgi:hypothetical protein
MLPNPAIRALVDDPALLHAQQERHAGAFMAWRSSDATAAVLADFSAFADGAPLSTLPRLGALFDGSGSARALIDRLVAAMVPAMAKAPFGQVPLRHHVSRAATTIMVERLNGASGHEASLALFALDGAGLALEPRAVSATFAPAEEWDVVLSGTGQGRLVEHRGVVAEDANPLAAHAIALSPGVALGRDAEREALLVDRVEGSLLLLRLRRRRPGSTPTRELDLANGRQLHQAASSARDSRHEIAVALLGRMGRKDAAPVLADLAVDRACGDMLRWQALRECLAMDTLSGFRALCAVAMAGDDPLAHPAGALRAQLIELHPVLAEIQPCPA